MASIVSVYGALTAIILGLLFASNRVLLQNSIITTICHKSIALSIQGLQASGELFGGAAKVLKKGESWAPIIPIDQPPRLAGIVQRPWLTRLIKPIAASSGCG